MVVNLGSYVKRFQIENPCIKNSFILLLQAILRNLLFLPESPDLISDSSSESEMELEQISHPLLLVKLMFFIFVLFHLSFYFP